MTLRRTWGGTVSTPDTPELYTPSQKVSEGAIFKVNADGSEEIVSYVNDKGKFVLLNQ